MWAGDGAGSNEHHLSADALDDTLSASIFPYRPPQSTADDTDRHVTAAAPAQPSTNPLMDPPPAYDDPPSPPSKQDPDAAASSHQKHRQHHHDGDETYARPPPNPDISVTLSEPEKHGDGIKNAFVSYRLSTTTRLEGFVGRQFSCRRRYGDFVTFHTDLQTQFPAVILPPLPSKKRKDYLDRFSEEFIERRRRRLEKYLGSVVAHPTMRLSSLLKRFLQDDDYESHAVAPDEKEGVLDNVTDSLLNAFSKVKNPDERYLAIAADNSVFEENLQQLEKQYIKYLRSLDEMGNAMGDVSFDLTAMAGLESDALQQPLQVAHTATEAMSLSLKAVVRRDEAEFLAGVHMLVGYAESVKETLKLREQKQIEHESLTDYLEQTTHEKERLSMPRSGSTSSLSNFLKDKYDEMKGADPERQRQHRLQKTEQKVNELQTAVENSREVAKQFTQQVGKELEYFETVRGTELKTCLGSLVANQLHCHRQLHSALETMISRLSASD